MKTRLISLLVVILFLISCNNASDNSTATSADTLSDSIADIGTIDSSGNLKKFTEGVLPLTIDSAALSDEHLKEEKLLSPLFVLNILKQHINAADDKESDYYLSIYLHIDSCLQKMTDEEFNNTLDIGMMKTVLLYAGDFYNLKNGNIAYTWFMKFSTYEACPFSAGTIMFLTTLDKSGNQVSSIILGESSGGGDAPYYSSTDIYSVLAQDYSITIKETQINGGDEEEGKVISETTKSEFRFQIVPETGEIKKISKKVGKPVKKYDAL